MGFDKIMNPPGYILTDSLYLNTDIHYPGKFYASNRAGMKIEFDENYEMTAVVRANKYFTSSAKLGDDAYIIKNKKEQVLINGDGQNLTGIVFTEEADFGDNRIFDQENNRILIYTIR